MAIGDAMNSFIYMLYFPLLRQSKKSCIALEIHYIIYTSLCRNNIGSIFKALREEREVNRSDPAHPHSLRHI